MMKQFLDAMREVFPECPYVIAYNVGFTLKTSGKTSDEMEELGNEAMQRYHETMSPWYARCTRRDETLLHERIEFLDELDLQTKWADNLHPATKDAIWDYINELNNFCCLMSWTRDIVPPNIMTAITSSATQMASKIRSGEMSMRDFNVMDLSQSIMGSVDPAELEQMGSALQSGNVDISSVFSMLTNMMPADSPDGVDIGSILSTMLPTSIRK